MTKRTAFLSLMMALAMSLSLATTAFAEDATKPRPATTTKAAIQNIKETAKAEIKKIREDQKDAKRKNLENELAKHISNVGKRFTENIGNLEKIIERINQRIVVLKTAGKDTTAAEALLSDARNNIQAAKDAIAKLPALQTAGVQAEKLSQGLADLRTAITAIENSLKTAKGDLSRIIGIIKGLGPVATPAEKSATSTATTTATH